MTVGAVVVCFHQLGRTPFDHFSELQDGFLVALGLEQLHSEAHEPSCDPGIQGQSSFQVGQPFTVMVERTVHNTPQEQRIGVIGSEVQGAIQVA